MRNNDRTTTYTEIVETLEHWHIPTRIKEKYGNWQLRFIQPKVYLYRLSFPIIGWHLFITAYFSISSNAYLGSSATTDITLP